jgi:hypothetical protein
MSQTPRNSCHNFLHTCTGLLLDFYASSLLYGCLEICAKCYNTILGIKCCTNTLGNVPKYSEKYPQKLFLISVQLNSSTDCQNLYNGLLNLLYFPSISMPNFCCTVTSKSVQYGLLKVLYLSSISMPVLMLYGLLNPYSTNRNKCCNLSSKCMPMLALECMPLAAR